MSLGRLRISSTSRLAAALLALSLSGATRAALALAPEREHRCQCASHGENHRCACKICNDRARRARRDELAKLPPCCRSKAAAQLAVEEERAQRESADPCAVPLCGGRDPDAPPSGSEDAFTLPPRATPTGPGRREPIVPAATSGPEAVATPELPPPRA
jgi:hypothetical protein